MERVEVLYVSSTCRFRADATLLDAWGSYLSMDRWVGRSVGGGEKVCWSVSSVRLFARSCNFVYEGMVSSS